eukprot:gene9260-9425_t
MELEHAWSSQQSQVQHPAEGCLYNLTAEALLVLNAEAERGLLHMLAAGLVPQQLQLSPALCQGRTDDATAVVLTHPHTSGQLSLPPITENIGLAAEDRQCSSRQLQQPLREIVQQDTTPHDVQLFKAAGNDFNAKQQHTSRNIAAPGMAEVIQCHSSDPSNNLGQAVCSGTRPGAQQVLVLASSACDSVMDYWTQLMGRKSGVDPSTVSRGTKSPMQEEAGCNLGGGPVPGGYIVPGVPVDADVDVAVQLQLPLLGPSPQLARVLSTRIGCRSLFAAAGIKLPPGGILPVSRRSLNTTTSRRISASTDGSAGSTGLKQLLLAMSLHLLQWPQQEKWLIKINSGSSGVTGLALLDTAEMQETCATVQRLAQRLEQHSRPATNSNPTASPALSSAAGKGSTPPLQSKLSDFQGRQRHKAVQPLDLQAVRPDSLQQALQQLSEALVCELYQGMKLVKQQHWQDLAAAAAAARREQNPTSSSAADDSADSGEGVASAAVGDAIDAYLDVLLTEVRERSTSADDVEAGLEERAVVHTTG